MSSENHSSSADVPSYTVEEIESATSEFIVKNAVRIFHRWRLPLESSLSAARDRSEAAARGQAHGKSEGQRPSPGWGGRGELTAPRKAQTWSAGEGASWAGPGLTSGRLQAKHKHEWVPNVAMRARCAEGSHRKEVTNSIFLSTYWSWSEKDTRTMKKYSDRSGCGLI